MRGPNASEHFKGAVLIMNADTNVFNRLITARQKKRFLNGVRLLAFGIRLKIQKQLFQQQIRDRFGHQTKINWFKRPVPFLLRRIFQSRNSDSILDQEHNDNGRLGVILFIVIRQ
jgi:hypothetical protein